MNFLQALLANPMLQMALFACLGASFASGMIGSYVVVKRIVSLSGSIAHSVLGGLGAALYFKRTFDLMWLHPLYGALLGALVSALIIGWVHLHHQEREDSVIAMIWSIGMAVGVIFVSLTPGFNVDLMNFLLGNVAWIAPSDLWLLVSLDGLILALCLLFHKRLVALCFDEKQAKLQGAHVTKLYLLLLALVALSVVLLIHTVGVILVLSMLVLPASIAERFTYRLSHMMIIAVILNMLFSVGGLALSYKFDWPAGATITLFSGCVYLISLKFKKSMRQVVAEAYQQAFSSGK